MRWVSSYRFGACIIEVCKAGNGSIIGEPPAQSAIVTELRMRRVDVCWRTIVAVVGASHDLDRFSFSVCATGKVKYAELATKMSKIRILPRRFGFLIYLVWLIIFVFDMDFVSHGANCVVIETKYHPAKANWIVERLETLSFSLYLLSIAEVVLSLSVFNVVHWKLASQHIFFKRHSIIS